MGRPFGRQGVVIGEDHIHSQGGRPLQGLPGRHAVIHRDDQAHAIGRQSLDHAGIEAVAIVGPTRDGGPWPCPEPLEHAHQQGRAGHAIGVIVAADGQAFARAAGPLQPLHRPGEVGEVVMGIGGRGGIQEAAEAALAEVAPASQHRQQLLRQIDRGAIQGNSRPGINPSWGISPCQWWWENPGLRVEEGQGEGQAPLHCAAGHRCRQP